MDRFVRSIAKCIGVGLIAFSLSMVADTTAQATDLGPYSGGFYCSGCDRNCGGAGGWGACAFGGCDALWTCTLCICTGGSWCSC